MPKPPKSIRLKWSSENKALWRRLSEHRFDHRDIAERDRGHDHTNQDASDPNRIPELTLRLALSAHIDLNEAEASIEEYRRFCFLAATVDRPLAPSRIVDKVWRTHITDSVNYRRFCTEVLRHTLHRDPPAGDEQDLSQPAYAETLLQYERYFGEPPEKIWPPAKKTAERHFQKKASRQLPLYIAPPKPYASYPGYGSRRHPRWLAATVLLSVASIAAYVLITVILGEPNPLRWDEVAYWGWCFVLTCTGLSSSITLRYFVLRPHEGGSREPAEPWELAYLTDGAERAADAILVHLIAQELVYVNHARRLRTDAGDLVHRLTLADGPPPTDLAPFARQALETIRLHPTLDGALKALRESSKELADVTYRNGWQRRPAQLRSKLYLAALPNVVVTTHALIALGFLVLNDSDFSMAPMLQIIAMGIGFAVPMIMPEAKSLTDDGEWQL